jgi:hypothetical protein
MIATSVIVLIDVLQPIGFHTWKKHLLSGETALMGEERSFTRTISISIAEISPIVK